MFKKQNFGEGGVSGSEQRSIAHNVLPEMRSNSHTKKTSTAHALKVVSLLSPMPLRQEEHQENVPFYN